MADDLVCEIAGGHRHVSDAGAGEIPDIVVDYGYAVNFKQGLGGGERHRPEAFPFPPGHKDGAQWQYGFDFGQVEGAQQVAVIVGDRQQFHTFQTRLFYLIDRGVGRNRRELPVCRLSHGAVEGHPPEQRASDVSVGDCPCHAVVRVGHNQGHHAVGQRVELSQRIDYSGIAVNYVILHHRSVVEARRRRSVIRARATVRSRGVSMSSESSADIWYGILRGKAPRGISRMEAGLMT